MSASLSLYSITPLKIQYNLLMCFTAPAYMWVLHASIDNLLDFIGVLERYGLWWFSMWLIRASSATNMWTLLGGNELVGGEIKAKVQYSMSISYAERQWYVTEEFFRMRWFTSGIIIFFVPLLFCETFSQKHVCQRFFVKTYLDAASRVRGNEYINQ